MNSIKYLKVYTIISLVLFLIYLIVYCIFFWIKEDFWGNAPIISFFVIPLIFCSVVWLFGRYTNKRHPKATKIISNILNVLAILVHTFFAIIFFLVASAFTYGIDHDEYTDIKDYQKVLDKFYPETVYYFPNPIPEEAKNVEMLKEPGSFTGDTLLYLKFDASDEYIKQERKKYKNVGKEYLIDGKNRSEDYQDARSKLAFVVHNDENGYRIRVLERNGCLSGIATRDKTIIYIMFCD